MMKKEYTINKTIISLIYIFIFFAISVMLTIYWFANQLIVHNKITIINFAIILVITVLLIYIIPTRSSLGACFNMKIEVDNESIYSIKRRKIKNYKWKDICEIKRSNSIFIPESHLTIWCKDTDEPIEIPVFMKNSKQLYKEIYENVKEKSPNAKIDKRFIKYVEEKC